MARSISVKVPTASLIEQLETRLAQINQDVANYPAAIAKYEADMKAHEKKIVKIVIDALKNKPELIGTDYNSTIRVSQNYGRRVEISVNHDALGIPEAPEKPENPNDRQSFGREWTTRKALIEKNLNILRMTSQEEVNASTYGAIMEIL